MSTAERREPAVRPMGRNGTDGNTAIIQNTAKASEPSTTLGRDASAMVDRWIELLGKLG